LHKEDPAEPIEVRKVYSKLFKLFLFRNSEVGILISSDFNAQTIEAVFLSCDSPFSLQNLIVVEAAANEFPFFFNEINVYDRSD